MEPLIKAKNLNFIYNRGKDNEFQALININFEIFPEEFIIIFGPSGCGKSTLLNVIAGLEQVDSGNIFIHGKEMSHMTRPEFVEYHRVGIGMIYQAYNLITSLTVLQNVSLPQLFVEVGRRAREKKGHELLKRFGIDEHAHKIPTELSGGQQQRIGIARSIINNPYIILADEPVGNLDSTSAKNVLGILKDLNEKEKKTLVVVTHNPEFLDYGDRIIHMKDGMITREVVNRQKFQKKISTNEEISKPPTSEIENLVRAYQGLTPEQINILIMPYKAKLFAHHFITTRNLQETKVFEDTMQRKLLNTITQDEFQDILNRPQEEGGVGFDIRSAGKISRRISRAIRMAYFIYRSGRQRKDETGTHVKITLDEKAEKLTEYLQKTCYLKYYYKLDNIAKLRIRQAVRDRLAKTIDKKDFYNILDMPFKDGGVGLNSKTARSFTEELELILILGYGVSQSMQMPHAFGEDGDDGRERPPSLASPTSDLPQPVINRIEEAAVNGGRDKAETGAGEKSEISGPVQTAVGGDPSPEINNGHAAPDSGMGGGKP